MRYNPSEAYALAIGHLSDRLRGGEAFVQNWPRHERVLTRDERMEMQQLLARRGFDIGESDGRFGPKTRAAIRDFQARAGLVPDGFATADGFGPIARVLNRNFYLQTAIFFRLLTRERPKRKSRAKPAE